MFTEEQIAEFKTFARFSLLVPRTHSDVLFDKALDLVNELTDKGIADDVESDASTFDYLVAYHLEAGSHSLDQQQTIYEAVFSAFRALTADFCPEPVETLAFSCPAESVSIISQVVASLDSVGDEYLDVSALLSQGIDPLNPAVLYLDMLHDGNADELSLIEQVSSHLLDLPGSSPAEVSA